MRIRLVRNSWIMCFRKTDIISSDLNETKRRVEQAVEGRTKLRTYREINPDFEINDIYIDKNINELERIKVTRLRLSSHNLAIETGRWSRLARERRLCQCREIQTEFHVICTCELTETCRNNTDLNFDSLLNFYKGDPKAIGKVVTACLKVFGH